MSGGLESLFEKQKKMDIILSDDIHDMNALITLLGDKISMEKKELFIRDSKLRGGILVLHNDVDWEVKQRYKTILSDGDKVAFISTLHGG